MQNDITITGVGPVSALGIGPDEFKSNLYNAQSCGRRLDQVETRTGVCPLDLTDVGGRVGAPICGEQEEAYIERRRDYLTKKQRSRLGWGAERMFVAAMEAIKDAGLSHQEAEDGIKLSELDSDRVGVFIGTNIPGGHSLKAMNETINEDGPRRVSPYTIPKTMPNQPASILSLFLNIRGPSFVSSTACASGNTALSQALMHLRNGSIDVAIAGGVDTILTRFHVVGFDRLKASSRRNDSPETASRPFDATRDGFVFGEGAGALILDARPDSGDGYMTMEGFGSTNDSHHITAPIASGDGAVRAMEKTLDKSGWAPDSVDYISAHGTSTPMNDAMETHALKTVFDDHAYDLSVSSLKSQIGHPIGAAGALEAIATAFAFQENRLPPTINYENPDDECDLNYVPNEPKKRTIGRALSNNFAFGGHNVVVAFERS